jgi:hypothetical protein
MEDNIIMWLEIDCHGCRIYHNFEPVRRNPLSVYHKLQAVADEMENEAARLREELEKVHAENTRLRESIEWAEECLSEEAAPHRADELRARAFPPKMGPVEVKVWAIIAPSGFIETTSVNEGLQRDQVANVHSPFYGHKVIELKGIDHRPIPAKVKRREEVRHTGDIRPLSGANVPAYPHRKVFAEWEE